MPEFPNDIIYGSQWCSGATKEKDELLPQRAIVLALLNWAFAIEKKSLGCPEKISEFPNAIMDFGSQWCSGGHKGER